MFLHLMVLLPVVMTDTIFLDKFRLSERESKGGIKAHHPKISGF